MPARVLAVANPKGGTGKTVTAIAIAAASARAGLRTLLIDLDPLGNATAALGARADGCSTADLLAGEGIDSRAVARPLASLGRLGALPATLDLLAIERELLARPRTGAVALAKRLPSLARAWDAVVCDCPPSLSPLTVGALLAADRVLVPLGAAMALELRAARRLFDVVADFDRELGRETPMAAFVSRARQRQTLAREGRVAAARVFEERLLEIEVPETVDAEKSVVEQMPLPLLAPEGKATRAFEELAAELLPLEPETVAAVEVARGA